ncbi:hypothetical protein BCR34DRAFT_572323 [Clohesyomyces aquaticus]|uniref:F-box domain-containing protein n=1 Tax=Clohesyomyces aquaticus TaxID=1231657 RepID=A0A1Y1Z4A8_9PLEO|nr:hypothetical protein BCR34DRAFT_572323 [Clohesyomyces aquaticus]
MQVAQYWKSSRVLPVLPCSCAPGHCTKHDVGRSQPDAVSWGSLWATLADSLPIPFLKSKDTRCHILSLPIELLQEILTHLGPHDQIVFIITCKALQQSLGPPWPKLLPSEHIDFLKAIQRDIPDYRLCRPCKILHAPTRNTITIPRNKLRRETYHRDLRAYVLAPHGGNDPDILYWLCEEHLQLAITEHICIDTLRCSGTLDLPSLLPKQKYMVGSAIFTFKIVPVISRRNVIFHAIYELNYTATTPQRVWADLEEDRVRELLLLFDIRCCLHCSTGQMREEMICFLFHSTQRVGSVITCTRGSAVSGEGCGHHIHACECTTEYMMEQIKVDSTDAPTGIRVFVWQWLGHRSDDYVLKQRGMLRNCYEDATLETFFSSLRVNRVH